MSYIGYLFQIRSNPAAMIENVLSRIGGVGVYGVISICLFFAVFVGRARVDVLPEEAVSESDAANCR